MIKGVITNDTWDGRVADDLLVDNPVLVLEWILRQQNLNSGVFTGQITDDYINMPMFDALYLSELNNLKIARELFSENETNTDYLIKSLCKEFFMINWQDGDGKECVDYIFKSRDTNQFAFTFSEIFDISQIKPPMKSNIYVEPVINYAYDYATEKYTKQARVLGITTESTWTAALTPGFTNANGELLWNKCKELYNHYGHYEPMPEELSNKLWITEYADMFWWVNRFYGLEMSGFCDWSRCSIDVGYYDALYSKNVDIGMIGTISLPHQTDGRGMKCLIESITPKKREKLVTLDIILLEYTESLLTFGNGNYQLQSANIEA